MPVSQIQEKTVEVIQLIPQDRMSDRIVKQTVNIAVQQRQVPTVQTVQNTVKIPQGQFLDKVVDMPGCGRTPGVHGGRRARHHQRERTLVTDSD